MRVVPRRSKGRRAEPGAGAPAAPVAVEEPGPPEQTSTPAPPRVDAPAEPPSVSGGRRAARKARRAQAKKRAASTEPLAPVPPPDPARQRRARSAERQRAAAEAKRSRAAYRQGMIQRGGPEAKAVRQHRSAMLVMVLTLGLLISAIAVSGALIAGSMRNRPVTLAAPLHVYPVTQSIPGQCPAGTQGVTGQTAGGMTCYQMAQGLAIRTVAELRVQKSELTAGQYDVAVTLRSKDRRAFADLTRATVGRDLAFVIRNRIVTLPRVDMPIVDGKVIVTGPPTRTDANRLVRELKGR